MNRSGRTSGVVMQIRKFVANALNVHAREDHQMFFIGQVTAVDTTNYVATVKLLGSATNVVQAKYGKKAPTHVAVNDYVYMLVSGNRSYVIFDVAGSLI